MKKLITTLVITLSIMGFFARDSHAWKPGSNLVKVLDTVPFIDPASSNEDAVDDMEFTGVGFGNNGPFEAQCGLTGNFDPTNPACVTAKAECGAALRECVVFECKSKDRGNRYKCGKDEWYDCSLTISYYISGSKSYSDTDAWNGCFNSPDTAQGETEGWVPGQDDDGIEEDNVEPGGTHALFNDDVLNQGSGTEPVDPAVNGQFPAVNPLQELADAINELDTDEQKQNARDYLVARAGLGQLQAEIDALPTEEQRQNVRDYLANLAALGQLKAEIDALPTEEQRQNVRDFLTNLVALGQLKAAIDALPTEEQRQKARDYFVVVAGLWQLKAEIDALPTEEQRQNVRDFLTALNEGAQPETDVEVTTRPNLDGVDLTLDGIDRDSFITDDGIDANAFNGGGCTLSSAQGLSNAWYLILGLLPLFQSLIRKRN